MQRRSSFSNKFLRSPSLYANGAGPFILLIVRARLLARDGYFTTP